MAKLERFIFWLVFLVLVFLVILSTGCMKTTVITGGVDCVIETPEFYIGELVICDDTKKDAKKSPVK